MAPSSLRQSSDESNVTTDVQSETDDVPESCNNTNGARGTNYPLPSTSMDEIHDLVCVGFGPASLAIAVALHDFMKQQRNAGNSIKPPKVRFLERQDAFKWHAGMLLAGAKMQISFLKDLATLRDPTSHFTFLNYLKVHDRLVHFSNLGTFLPSRVEFNDYLQWAAKHFDNVVDYSQEVHSIRPAKISEADRYDILEVVSHNACTKTMNVLRARNVVIAAGGRPAKPAIFPDHHDQIIHSSEYNNRIDSVLPDRNASYSIAVIGGGQSAAEIFNNLHGRYPQASTRLVLRATALRPSDDSPFVNEVFNPEAVAAFFELPKTGRATSLQKDKATNYSVVRLELLEKLYEDLYIQRVGEPDGSKWQHQILVQRAISDVIVDTSQRIVDLVLGELGTTGQQHNERLRFDAVVLATGYHRDAHVEMLKGCQEINADPEGRWLPKRDYSIALDRGVVDNGLGIWLQGCNESTHGLSDSLLSILATRGGEMIKSIFGPC